MKDKKTKNVNDFLNISFSNNDFKNLLINIKSCYFIDYENVMSNGFKGIEALKKKDIVCIFYSNKANKMTMQDVAKIAKCKSKIYTFKVDIGYKNALDFQMISFLGFIIAKHQEKNIQIPYYIISNDRGFNSTIEFWKKFKIDIKRQAAIQESEIQTENETKKETEYSYGSKMTELQRTQIHNFLKKRFSKKETKKLFSIIMTSENLVELRNEMVKNFDENFALKWYKPIKQQIPNRK